MSVCELSRNNSYAQDGPLSGGGRGREGEGGMIPIIWVWIIEWKAMYCNTCLVYCTMAFILLYGSFRRFNPDIWRLILAFEVTKEDDEYDRIVVNNDGYFGGFLLF